MSWRSTVADVLANRPAAGTGNAGWIYLATDVNGGTPYRSDGSTWVQMGAGVSEAAEAHALLDGSIHSDTAAQTVSRGSLVYGNATPKWDELVVGAANALLGTDGTDVSWFGCTAAGRAILDDANATAQRTTLGLDGSFTVCATSGTVLTVGGGATASEVRWLEPSGGGTSYVGFKSPALAGNTVYSWPNAFPAVSGYVLSCTDAGVMSWAAASGGGTWGSITGTLSDQTDLQAELDAKVVGPASATDNAIARFDGTTGKLIQDSGVTVDDTTGKMTFPDTGAVRGGTTAGFTFYVAGYNVGTGLYGEFITVTAGTPATCNLDDAVTKAGGYIYRAGGTDVPVTDGGTGASTAAGAATNLGLGTGDSPQFTGINLGHASDTTLTRASAGNVNIEGNLVYRAGGTDVPVADGGTGASTSAGAATNLGLGTGDSPQFAGINVGHASDSTITRISAGVLAVEGDKITLNAVAAVLTNKDLIDTTNTYRAASDTVTGALEIAVQSEMETGTDTTRAVVPGRMQYHPGVAKGWACIEGTGMTLSASHNVSSITDNGVGDFTVNWGTDFSGDDYAVGAMSSVDTGGTVLLNPSQNTSRTGAAIRINLVNAAGTALADAQFTGVVGYGDQA